MTINKGDYRYFKPQSDLVDPSVVIAVPDNDELKQNGITGHIFLRDRGNIISIPLHKGSFPVKWFVNQPNNWIELSREETINLLLSVLMPT